MKKYSLFALFLFSAIAFIPAACLNRHKEIRPTETAVKSDPPNSTEAPVTVSVNTGPAEEHSKAITKGKPEPEKKLPKNWPWRGVCMPSAWWEENDVAYLHSIGVNFIRIQIKSPKRARREKSDPRKAFFDELEWVDKVLDECKKYDMTSIIAFNYLVLDPNSKVDDKSPEFWNNRIFTDSAFAMVDLIARRYKDRGDELSAYEVIGEPAEDTNYGLDSRAKAPAGIENFYKSALAVIRKYDTERYFLLTPGPWGLFTSYAKFQGYNIKDPKLIYGAHYYLPNKYTQQGIKGRKRGLDYPGFYDGRYWDKEAIVKTMNMVKDFERRTGALIYIGEFQSIRWAPGANQWVKDVVSELERNEWSWTYFAYKPDFEFWDPFMEVKNANEPKDKWELKKTGREAVIWKYMISNYFSKNKK